MKNETLRIDHPDYNQIKGQLYFNAWRNTKSENFSWQRLGNRIGIGVTKGNQKENGFKWHSGGPRQDRGAGWLHFGSGWLSG